MPVAVPTGHYDLEVSLDLNPILGKIEHVATVDVVVPSEKILEERLAQLDSADVNVRRTALIDLRNFREDGDTVFPKLLAQLSDEEASIRMLALSVMMAYPKHTAEHADTFIEILLGDESVSVSEKSNAAMLLSRYVPPSEKVGAALEKAYAGADQNLKTRLQYSIDNYRQRVATTQPE